VDCWKSRGGASETAVLAAMLTYDVLVTIYLIYVGVGGEMAGILLWPAIALHTVLAILLAYVWFNDQLPNFNQPE
jgi:hypothetical protein